MPRCSSVLLLAILTFVSCRSSLPIPQSEPLPAIAAGPARRVTAAVYAPDGTLWVARTSRTGCDLMAVGRFEARSVERCPDRIIAAGDDLLLLGDGWSRWAGADGTTAEPVVDARSRDDLLIRTSSGLVRLRNGRRIAIPLDLVQPRILPDDEGVGGIVRSADGFSLVRIRDDGTVIVLGGPWRAIDSWDVAPKGKEAVVSAEVESGFDVLLLSTDGGEPTAVPREAYDEIGVTWAPRGNKVTYSLTAPWGTVYRSVHVPTAFQLTVDQAGLLGRRPIWEPQAERFAFIAESPFAPPHLRSMRYGGEEPRVEISPDRSLDREATPLTGVGGRAIVIPPPAMRYGTRYPVVIWRERGDLLGWSDDRANLLARGDVALVIADRDASVEAIVDHFAGSEWALAGRVIVVDPEATIEEAGGAAVVISRSGEVGSDRMLRRNSGGVTRIDVGAGESVFSRAVAAILDDGRDGSR